MSEKVLFCRGCKNTYRPKSDIGEKTVRCPNCGENLTLTSDPQETIAAGSRAAAGGKAPEDPWVGKVIGGCRIEKKLGHGGMASVYRAKHLRLDISVAVKIMDRAATRGDNSFVQRFVREARSAARVRHPNVVSVLDVGRQNDSYYILMELVEGGSVRDLIEKNGKIPPGRALGIVYDVAKALKAAHDRKLVHRDIKPENIMLDLDGTPKLADLGLVRSEEEKKDFTLTRSGIVVGTPYYIAPEQIEDSRAADIRSDIYSLGAALYHMVCGRTPFSGPSAVSILMKHLKEQPPAPQEANPDLPAPLDRLILKMMAKRSEDRPQTPEDLMADIKAAAREMGVQGGGKSVVQAVSLAHTARRNLPWVITAAVLVAAVVLAAVVTISMERRKAAGKKREGALRPVPAAVAPLARYRLLIFPDYVGSRFLLGQESKPGEGVPFAWIAAACISDVLQRVEKIDVEARPAPILMDAVKEGPYSDTVSEAIRPQAILCVSAARAGEQAVIRLVWLEGKVSEEFFETRIKESLEKQFCVEVDRCVNAVLERAAKRAAWKSAPQAKPCAELLPDKYRLLEFHCEAGYHEALAEWEPIIRKANLLSKAFGTSADLAAAMGLALVATGNDSAAIAALKDVNPPKGGPASEASLLIEFLKAYVADEGPRAKLAAENYLTTFSLSARGHLLLGLVRERMLGRLDDAQASYKLGLAVDPLYLPCCEGMVRVLLLQRKPQDARSSMRTYLTKVKSFAPGFALRAERILEDTLGLPPGERPRRPRDRGRPSGGGRQE